MKKIIGILALILFLVLIVIVYMKEGQKGIEMEKKAVIEGQEQINAAKQSMEDLNKRTKDNLQQAQELMEEKK